MLLETNRSNKFSVLPCFLIILCTFAFGPGGISVIASPSPKRVSCKTASGGYEIQGDACGEKTFLEINIQGVGSPSSSALNFALISPASVTCRYGNCTSDQVPGFYTYVGHQCWPNETNWNVKRYEIGVPALQMRVGSVIEGKYYVALHYRDIGACSYRFRPGSVEDPVLDINATASCTVRTVNLDDVIDSVPQCAVAPLPVPPVPLDLVPIVVPSVVIPVGLGLISYFAVRWYQSRKRKLTQARAKFREFVRKRARNLHASEEGEFSAVRPPDSVLPPNATGVASPRRALRASRAAGGSDSRPPAPATPPTANVPAHRPRRAHIMFSEDM